MTAEVKNGNLVITIPVYDPPQPSRSGKTLVIASTRGPIKFHSEHQGKPIVVNATAWVNK